jgi:hypothetical protein
MRTEDRSGALVVTMKWSSVLAGLACCLLPAACWRWRWRTPPGPDRGCERRASCVVHDVSCLRCGPEEAEQDVDVAQFTTCGTTCPLLWSNVFGFVGTRCMRVLASHIGSNPHATRARGRRRMHRLNTEKMRMCDRVTTLAARSQLADQPTCFIKGKSGCTHGSLVPGSLAWLPLASKRVPTGTPTGRVYWIPYQQAARFSCQLTGL